MRKHEAKGLQLWRHAFPVPFILVLLSGAACLSELRAAPATDTSAKTDAYEKTSDEEVLPGGVSANFKIAASATFEHAVRIVDIPTGKGIRRLPKIANGIQCAIISPDGKLCATGDFEGYIRVYNLATGKQLKEFLACPPPDIAWLDFSPDSKLLAAGGAKQSGRDQDNSVLLLDVETGKLLRKFKTEQGDAYDAVKFSPDGKSLAGAGDGNLLIWDVDTGRRLHTFSIWPNWPQPRVQGIAFSPDGRTVAAAGGNESQGLLKLFDIETGKGRLLRGHDRWINGIAYSPDGKLIASGSGDTTVRLWSAETGKLLRTLEGHTLQVMSVAFSPDGKMLASGGKDCTLRLWDVGTGQLLRSIGAEVTTPTKKRLRHKFR